jgi:hypothetical protein
MQGPKVLRFLSSLTVGAFAQSPVVGAQSSQQPVAPLLKDGSMGSPREWLAGFNRLASFDPLLVITGEAIE